MYKSKRYRFLGHKLYKLQKTNNGLLKLLSTNKATIAAFLRFNKSLKQGLENIDKYIDLIA